MSSHSQIPPAPVLTEAQKEERQELEALAATLPKASRSFQFLLYIGDKYFRQQTETLHEYDIATEVFGRSKSSFNPGEDAVVRVEAHRLRKKIKEYYEGEAKGHKIQLSIPPGSYVPVFTRYAEGTEKPESTPATPPPSGSRWWFYAVAATVLLLVAGGVTAIFHRHDAGKNNALKAAPAPYSTASPKGVPYAQVPLRILAGYTGKPQIDSSGNVWLSDRYGHYGGTWTRPPGVIERTSDPMLFQHWRDGSFSYDIPLRPGVYELHLYFVATNQDPSGPSSFSVAVNGKEILQGFDINSDVIGPNTADERVFRDVSPGPDGYLHLTFNGERAQATLNALEILPGLPHTQLPVRIAVQPTSFTDHAGHFWHPDDYYLGGYVSGNNTAVTETPDPDLYAGERYGNFSYAIPVVPGDQYTLTLHFVERYFGPSAPGGGGVGSRVFRVLCNGQTLLDNFDIYKQAGSFHALTETFHNLKPTPQGKLNITFQPIRNNATVSAIEVIDESQ